jgi:hypothetical protein
LGGEDEAGRKTVNPDDHAASIGRMVSTCNPADRAPALCRGIIARGTGPRAGKITAPQLPPKRRCSSLGKGGRRLKRPQSEDGFAQGDGHQLSSNVHAIAAPVARSGGWSSAPSDRQKPGEQLGAGVGGLGSPWRAKPTRLLSVPATDSCDEYSELDFSLSFLNLRSL